jgi:hypothetical protein
MQLPGANLARMIASMGFDFVLVDAVSPPTTVDSIMSSPASHVLVQEHGDIDDGEMHRLVAAIGNQGCSPIVRIPAPENFIVKRALDTGGEPTHHLAGGERSSTLLPPSFSSWPSMPHDVDRGKPMSPTEHRKAALDDVSQADARKFVSYCRFPSPRDTRPTAEHGRLSCECQQADLPSGAD